MPVDQRWWDSARPAPVKVQLRTTTGPETPAPVATNQTLSALTVQWSMSTCEPLGANSAGLDEPWCLALRLTATWERVMRLPPTPTLFMVSSMMRSRAQQSWPFNHSAVKCGWVWLISCGGHSMWSDSMPTCERRAGGVIFTTAVPGGLRYLASKESESGTSMVSLLPAMAVMVRSALVVVPTLSQVSGLPSRTMSSICMNLTQLAVTGRRMEIMSPTA